jgi:hypothetical protein
MFFNTSKQTELGIYLLTEFTAIAKIRANLMKSEDSPFKVKAKLPIKVNNPLVYPVYKNKNIRLLGGFFRSQKLL